MLASKFIFCLDNHVFVFLFVCLVLTKIKAKTICIKSCFVLFLWWFSMRCCILFLPCFCRDSILGSYCRCYRIFHPDKSITWNEAYSLCLERGEDLVMLETKDKMRKFQRLLRTFRKIRHLHVGLSLSSDLSGTYDPMLNHLYQKVIHVIDTLKSFPGHFWGEYQIS